MHQNVVSLQMQVSTHADLHRVSQELLVMCMYHVCHPVAVLHQLNPSHVLYSAGLQELSRLQRLEVVHVPCTNPNATTRLAAHLPALRSLDLWCCSTAGAHDEAAGQLTLAAATALTELRLHVCAQAAGTVQRLQMPPRLQVLTAGPPNCDSIFQCAHTKAVTHMLGICWMLVEVSAISTLSGMQT